MTFDEWWKKYLENAYLPNAEYKQINGEKATARAVWEYRQKEIDRINKDIDMLITECDKFK